MNGVLVVPCYNEAARLDPSTYLECTEQYPALNILFVDDGSRDRTREVLLQLVALRPDRLSLLALDQNAGKAEAVRRGMQQALRLDAEFVGYWDADLATPLSAIADFQNILDREPACEILIGSRVRLLGRDIRRLALRHYLGRVFATAASISLRLPVYDTQCGAKVFRATERTARLFEEPFISRWIFDVEILARYMALCKREGIADPDQRIYEVALRRWQDVSGSKLRTRDFVRSIADLGRIWLTYRGGSPA